jgi:hypothetical protein
MRTIGTPRADIKYKELRLFSGGDSVAVQSAGPTLAQDQISAHAIQKVRDVND